MQTDIAVLRPRHRGRRSRAVAAVVLGVAMWGMAPAEGAPNRFREVGRVPLFDAPAANASRSGWLILNPARRRGYQVVEVPTPSVSNPRTILTSFDLDTLQPLRRVSLAGLPIVGGAGNAAVVGSTRGAEIVHAVDAEAGRLYLAMSVPQAIDQTPAQFLSFAGAPSDGRRPRARFVAIDEAMLDQCGGQSDCPVAASFREPAGQERLHPYWVAGMTVTRHHVAAGSPGRLLVLFAHPQPNSMPFYDHTLALWDTGALAFSPGAVLETAPNVAGLSTPGQLTVQRASASGQPRRLDACTGGSLASAGAHGVGGYQWGLLALRDAVWTGCQVAEGSGAVTRVALDAAGHLDPVAPHPAYRLSRRLADVLVDEGGARLYLRSFGGGDVLWVFDTAPAVFTGEVPVKPRDSYSAVFGVHPRSGRVYALVQDHEVFVGGVSQPVQGGLQYADPPGGLTNVRPDLAYPAGYAIRVDPVTNRFFVRFGHQAIGMTPTYPGTDSTTPAPAEAFYRVFEDRVK